MTFLNNFNIDDNHDFNDDILRADGVSYSLTSVEMSRQWRWQVISISIIIIRTIIFSLIISKHE